MSLICNNCGCTEPDVDGCKCLDCGDAMVEAPVVTPSKKVKNGKISR